MRRSFLFDIDTPMARQMQAFPWERTPLGAPEGWDGALKTLVPILLASNQPMFVAWGPHRTLLYNDAYVGLLASKHPAALGGDFLEVWHEIRGELTPLVQAAYRGEPSQADHIELWMQRRGYREETHFSYFYAPVRADSGEVGGFFCACNEITAQVLAERRLALSEARHRGVLENMGEGFTLFDADFNILEVNEAAMALIGLPRPELIGRNHWERFPGTFDAPVGRMYRQVMDDRQPRSLEHLYRFDDGRQVWFEVRAFPVGDGLAALFQDVTKRKRLQFELSASLERVQLALDAGAILGTWVWDIAEDLVFADERFAVSFGLDPEALKAGLKIQHAFDAIHADDRPRVQDAVARAVRERSRYRCQYRVLRDGAYRWVEAVGRVEVDETGKPHRFPGVLLDHEERRRIEDERSRMIDALRDADRRKDEFLAMLAHELRNPLAPISYASQVLQLGGTDPARVQASAETIARQAGHLSKLVDDLLDVSRVTRGLVDIDRQPVDLRVVASTAAEQVKPLLHSRRHRLDIRVGAGSFTVSGDFHRLVQIVANLLNNAAKYTAPGGTIEIALSAEQDRAVLAVTDNGMGIAEGMLDKVFDLFTQAQRTPDRGQGGLGIGLALVRSLVRLHDGNVRADSGGPGLGSIFRIDLPLLHVDARAPAPPHDPAAADTHRRVLVVDDNLDAATTLAEALHLRGYAVVTACDGQSALAELESRADWDAFVLDVGLPDVTGYELAQRIRQSTASHGATFIALTGYGQPQDRERSRASGFDHHLVKPADLGDLVRILSRESGR